METEEAVWSEDQILKLLDSLKQNIPKYTRNRSWKCGMKSVDWNQIAFEPFSPEECRRKWDEILQKMCKVRTLPELLIEAEKANSSYLENSKVNPEHPKRPPTVYVDFYKNNIDKLKKEFPNAHQSELLQHSAKKYKQLPEEEKQQYEKKYKLAKEDYRRRVLEFKKCFQAKQVKMVSKDKELQNDQEETNAEDTCLHPKIPQTGYGLFRKEQLDLMGDVPFSNYGKVWGERWRKLTDKQKAEYHKRCQEMKKEHGIKSNSFMLQNDRETNAEDSVLTCKPPVSGYRLFCREHLHLVVDVLERKYPAVWRRHWKKLTETQRKKYIRRCEEIKREHAAKLTKYLEGLDKEEQDQVLKEYNLKRPKLPKGKGAQLRGEPSKPALSGENTMPSSEQMKHVKEIKNSSQRCSTVSQILCYLSKMEMAPYDKNSHTKIQRYIVELQRKFKTLTPTEQEQCRRKNPSICIYVDAKHTPAYDEELCEYQPSDSEDEELEDSSSEEDMVITEDEEEEADDMF